MDASDGQQAEAEAFIARLVNEAPLPTPEQAQRLARLLYGGATPRPITDERDD